MAQEQKTENTITNAAELAKSAAEAAALREQFMGERTEDVQDPSDEDLRKTAPLPELKKVYISLHKSYCRQMDDKFREGSKFNVMTMPKGTQFHGQDIGGGKNNPHYMSESKFNPNLMTATYYMDPNASLEVKLSLPDGTFRKVNVEELKEAIDTQSQRYREQQKTQEQQRDQQADQNRSKAASKSTDEEIA